MSGSRGWQNGLPGSLGEASAWRASVSPTVEQEQYFRPAANTPGSCEKMHVGVDKQQDCHTESQRWKGLHWRVLGPLPGSSPPTWGPSPLGGYRVLPESQSDLAPEFPNPYQPPREKSASSRGMRAPCPTHASLLLLCAVKPGWALSSPQTADEPPRPHLISPSP